MARRAAARDPPDDRTVDRLIEEAASWPTVGWDFGPVRGRLETSSLPWDFWGEVLRQVRGGGSLLDLGTGGGESFSRLLPRPARSVATESYPPNTRMAYRRLSPLGADVVRTLAPPGNDLQTGSLPTPSLPFRSGSFEHVIDRNEGFVASEVARVLAPGGTFLTEQTGGREFPEVLRMLELPLPTRPPRAWGLGMAREQLEAQGLRVVRGEEARFELTIRDVGALVWYLRMVPWVAPGFSLPSQLPALRRIHASIAQEGPLRIPRSGFFLEARKDGTVSPSHEHERVGATVPDARSVPGRSSDR